MDKIIIEDYMDIYDVLCEMDNKNFINDEDLMIIKANHMSDDRDIRIYIAVLKVKMCLFINYINV